MKYFPSGYRTRYSPRVSDPPADYIGSRREALDAELAHEVEADEAPRQVPTPAVKQVVR